MQRLETLLDRSSSPCVRRWSRSAFN